MGICCKIVIIILTELFVTLIFAFITPKEKKAGFFDVMAISKGLAERAFITIALLSNFPHVLTLFGALKLGTRLKDGPTENSPEAKKREQVYNTYYLIGNFISVTLSIAYYNLLK